MSTRLKTRNPCCMWGHHRGSVQGVVKTLTPILPSLHCKGRYPLRCGWKSLAKQRRASVGGQEHEDNGTRGRTPTVTSDVYCVIYSTVSWFDFFKFCCVMLDLYREFYAVYMCDVQIQKLLLLWNSFSFFTFMHNCILLVWPLDKWQHLSILICRTNWQREDAFWRHSLFLWDCSFDPQVNSWERYEYLQVISMVLYWSIQVILRNDQSGW